MTALLFIEYADGPLAGTDSPVLSLPSELRYCSPAGTVVTYAPTGETNAKGRHVYKRVAS